MIRGTGSSRLALAGHMPGQGEFSMMGSEFSMMGSEFSMMGPSALTCMNR
jgi:hypothetical protein